MGVMPQNPVIQAPKPIYMHHQNIGMNHMPQDGHNVGFVKHGTAHEKPHDTDKLASNPSHAQPDNDHGNHEEGKDDNESDDAYSDDPKSRTSASSRVNFSKLTAEEKERRCHNMSKEVKQLRRKIRNMEERLARASTGGEYRPEEGNASVNESLVQRAKDKLRSYSDYELSDQKDLIENLCTVISQERLKPDSLAFYMLCTLVRGFLTQEEWNKYQNSAQNHGNNDDNDQFGNKEILVSFPEKEVRISKKEFKVFAPYHENEQIMRLLTGQLRDIGSSSKENGAFIGNDQVDLLGKMMQNGSNGNNFQAMQNLMNTQGYGGGIDSHNSTSHHGTTNMLASAMNLSNQAHNPLYDMGGGLQNHSVQNGLNPQSNQMLASFMTGQMQNNPNLQWTMQQMASMGGMNGMDKSLNDLINGQMMNFNGNPYMGQSSGLGHSMGQNNKNHYGPNQDK